MSASERVRQVYDQAQARHVASPTLDRLDAALHAVEGVPALDGSITLAELVWIAQQLRVAPNCRILDIGSGSGGDACVLARETGCYAFGIDLMWERVVAANAHSAGQRLGGRAKFLQADSTQGLAFHANCFDAAAMLDALVHIQDKVFVFGEIARVLVSNGRLTLSTILGTQLPPSHARVLEETTGSLYRIEWQELIALLAQAGFNIVAQRDRTSQLLRWHSRRDQTVRSAREELIPELGAEEYELLLRRIAVMVELLGSGRLTSAIVIAEKQG